MDFTPEEKEIRQILGKTKLKTPAKESMADFEKKVWTQIKGSQGTPSFGLGFSFVLIFALALALAAGYFMWVKPAKDLQPVASKLIEAPVAEPEEPRETVVIRDYPYDELAHDLLLLEMLGEDEGMIDGFEPLAVELEFLPHTPGAIV